jgi:hypothetical protein
MVPIIDTAKLAEILRAKLGLGRVLLEPNMH